MKSIYILGIAATAMLTAPAMAQDASLSGPYLGVVAGFDSVRASALGDSGSESDFMYGVVAGYDYDLGKAVIGVEAEIADSAVSIGAASGGESVELNAGRDLYLGVRAGVKLAPGTLLYAKAGYTNARINATYDDGVEKISDGANMDGFRLGAGIEQSFGRFSVRGEYRYSDYGRLTVDGVNTGLSFQRHQVVAALIGKF